MAAAGASHLVKVELENETSGAISSRTCATESNIPSSIYPLQATTCLCQSLSRDQNSLEKDKERFVADQNDQQECRRSHCEHMNDQK